jgi:Na+/H+ antiporter NhaB
VSRPGVGRYLLAALLMGAGPMLALAVLLLASVPTRIIHPEAALWLLVSLISVGLPVLIVSFICGLVMTVRTFSKRKHPTGEEVA